VTRWTPRTVLAAPLTAYLLGPALVFWRPAQAAAQSPAAPATIVIVTGDQATLPIPTLMEGPQGNVANYEIADQLFLHLAELGPTLTTAGDRGFVPLLAQRWVRRDSVTVAFDLDPRATWQDGRPVTAEDVVFTFGRARDPAIAPRLAGVLRHITAVTAEGDRRVVFRYSEPYAEQVYDAVFHVAPLPAHLLARLSPEELRHSPFLTSPVGSGPYRWVRSVGGEYIELGANERFFLGAPAIRRVIVRVAADPDARINLVLSGEADAMDNVPPPLLANLRRVGEDPDVRLVPVPSPTVGYLLFNQRDPRDSSRPHPVLADPDVRRAIILSLDRPRLVRAVLGAYAKVPYGPVSPILWIGHGTPTPLAQDVARARHLLARRGWADHDGDGVVDRDGQPLSLTLSVPNTSGIRRQLSLLVQEQLRQVGLRIEVHEYDFPVWNQRRSAGLFDIDFSAVSQDPSPSGLSQSWSCRGANNVARYCDPTVDSLMDRATRGGPRTAETWRATLTQIENDAPAAFMYAPLYVYAVNRRFTNVTIRPESSWLALREWRVAPARTRKGTGD
jgi:peptide/nickel transport system substrate-binding protein